MTVQVRRVRESDHDAAAGVAARAFCDQGFMIGMLGEDPVERLAGAYRLYAGEAWDPAAITLGAYVGDALLGIVRASPVGACTACRTVDPASPPEDEIARKDWEFEVGVVATHAQHGDHAWISRMAVEPRVAGHGIGGRLVEAAVAELAAYGPGTVLLECLSVVESWYLAHGFVRLDDVPEPWADDVSYLMARELRP
ncbi:MAG TPA: GNAT family N-acetyltransferase [Candidatus Nanopelagicales bacterium]|nr:GNAT family N-acetyltransferase [Candidatus Nanopelagicales bacterium]